MPTVKDVAKLAGTSVSTTSIVLSGRSVERKISAATQTRVWEAASQLNYQPNIAARRLKMGGRASTVVMIFWAEDSRASMLVRFLRGLQRGIGELQRPIELVFHFYSIDRLHELNDFFNGNYCNAAIVCNASQKDMDFLENARVEIPVVLYNRHTERFCTVNVDDFELGFKTARLLAERGHKTSGILGSFAVFPGMAAREEAYINTLKKEDVVIHPSNIIRTDNSMKGGHEGALAMIEQGRLPSSLFCVSDNIAVGAIKAFHQNRIRIPEDIEIISIGNGDLELEEYIHPSLSVIHLPMEKMAASCIQLINDLMEQRVKPPLSINHELDFILRESCPDKK